MPPEVPSTKGTTGLNRKRSDKFSQGKSTAGSEARRGGYKSVLRKPLSHRTAGSRAGAPGKASHCICTMLPPSPCASAADVPQTGRSRPNGQRAEHPGGPPRREQHRSSTRTAPRHRGFGSEPPLQGPTARRAHSFLLCTTYASTSFQTFSSRPQQFEHRHAFPRHRPAAQ